MEDNKLTAWLKKNDAKALEAIIDRYTPYVSTVVSNQLGRLGRTEDVEELTSDVFLCLWRHRSTLHTCRLRGWLGTTARNAARTFLRRQGEIPVSEEDVLLVSEDTAWVIAEKREQARLVRQAVAQLGWPDHEVFLRYYYYDQKVAEIAEEMGLNTENVKTKLRRGRSKLKIILEQGGCTIET